MKMHFLRRFALLLMAACTVGQPAAAGQAPPLQCLPVEGCGCFIWISGQTCPAGSVHFFHELADGAPLQFDPGTGPVVAVSTQAQSNTFSPGAGDSWTETYRYGEGSIEIRYSPGTDACVKLAQGEQCEYFDIRAWVVFESPQGSVSYQGTGSCGC
jgi:hypothetical protein